MGAFVEVGDCTGGGLRGDGRVCVWYCKVPVRDREKRASPAPPPGEEVESGGRHLAGLGWPFSCHRESLCV